MTKLLKIDVNKPDDRRLSQVVEVLRKDGVIIYPTDSVYTLGCSIFSKKGYKRLCQLKDVKEKKAQFSIVCSDFSHLSEFSGQLSNHQFKTIKSYLPGPFTFILPSNKNTEKIFQQKKKTVGFRIPDYTIVQEMVAMLNSPVFSASVQLEEETPYATTAEELYDQYEGKVDMIIDGGICGEIPTTIVDITTDEPEILRQGAGEFVF